jgi:hypothetical protein
LKKLLNVVGTQKEVESQEGKLQGDLRNILTHLIGHQLDAIVHLSRKSNKLNDQCGVFSKCAILYSHDEVILKAFLRLVNMSPSWYGLSQNSH